jgi:hypothetical protein
VSPTFVAVSFTTAEGSQRAVDTYSEGLTYLPCTEQARCGLSNVLEPSNCQNFISRLRFCTTAPVLRNCRVRLVNCKSGHESRSTDDVSPTRIFGPGCHTFSGPSSRTVLRTDSQSSSLYLCSNNGLPSSVFSELSFPPTGGNIPSCL